MERLVGTRPEAAIAAIAARRGRRADAADDGRKLALIVEGGAMRGVFSSGADIALEELGLTHAFDQVYGCSAGALNAAYFLAGQAAYGTTIYYQDINNSVFINPWRGFNRVLDLDYLFGEIMAGRKPLDTAAVLASPSRFFISVTDATTGEALLLEAGEARFGLLEMLRASATHPMLSGPTMQLGERPCFDGGFANLLPLADAIASGCTDILVFLTRPATHVEPAPGLMMRELFRWRCARGRPRLMLAGADMHERENASRGLATGRRPAPPGVNIATICPPEGGMPVTQTTRDGGKLRAAAVEGARMTLQAFDSHGGELVEVLKYHRRAIPAVATRATAPRANR